MLAKENMHRASQGLRLARGTGILAAGEVLSRGLNFLAFSRLARLLSLSGYGLLELAQAVMILLTMVVDLGTGKTGTREIAANGGSSPRMLVGTIVSVQFVVSIMVIILVGFFCAHLTVEPTLKRLLWGFALSLIGYPLLLGWVFVGQGHVMPVAVLQVVRRAVFLAATLIVVHSSADLLRLPWAEIAAVAVSAVGYVLLMRGTQQSIMENAIAEVDLRLFRQCLPIFGSQLVWACRMYAPTLILALYCDSVSIGFFSAALRIVMVFQALVATYFVTLFPVLSEASSESGSLIKYLNQSMRDALWPLAIVALAVTFSAPTIVRFVFGVKFLKPEATTTLAILIWLIPITAWRRHYSEALIALRLAEEEVICSLFGLALLVVLTVEFSRIGVLGGACAMLIAESTASALTAWRLRHHLRQP